MISGKKIAALVLCIVYIYVIIRLRNVNIFNKREEWKDSLQWTESLGKVRPACLSLFLDMPILEERWTLFSIFVIVINALLQFMVP